MIEKSLAIVRVKAPDSPVYFRTLAQLGHLYAQQGNYKDSDAILKQCLAYFRSRSASEHPATVGDTKDALDGLAMNLYDLGKPAQADALLQEALTIKSAHDTDNVQRFYSSIHRCRCLLKLGKIQEANAICRTLPNIIPDWMSRPRAVRGYCSLIADMGFKSQAEDLLKDRLSVWEQ